MDVVRLHRGRQTLRIGHCREVAVVGVADPTRTGKIGAVFPGAAAAEHRLIGRRDDIGCRSSHPWARSIRDRIPDRSRRVRKNRDRRIRADGRRRRSCGHCSDRGTGCPTGKARPPSTAAETRPATKLETAASRSRLGVEGGVDVGPGAAAGARERRPRPAWDWHRTRKRPATCRPTSGFNASRSLPKPCGRSRARAVTGCSIEPTTPVRLNSARSVGASTITSATSPEKWMSLAPIDSSTRSSLRSG